MRWKSLCLLILKSITESKKYFKSLYDFGGRCLKIKDVCMDFEPYFKVHNLVSVHPKSFILVQMTNLNMVFHMVVSVYRLIKILKLAPVPWWISKRLIERRVNDSGDFCLLWLVILKSVWYSVGGRELWLAILSSLLCHDRNIRIGKQGYVFILSDFKRWCFIVSVLTSISVSTVILTLRKVEFFN